MTESVTAVGHAWAAAPVKIIYGPDGALVLQVCELYGSHKVTALLQDHHVIPESWWRAAGKPVASPMIKLCPTCHYNVHAGIDTRLKGADYSVLPARVEELVSRAYDGAEQNGLTPARTL